MRWVLFFLSSGRGGSSFRCAKDAIEDEVNNCKSEKGNDNADNTINNGTTSFRNLAGVTLGSNKTDAADD